MYDFDKFSFTLDEYSTDLLKKYCIRKNKNFNEISQYELDSIASNAIYFAIGDGEYTQILSEVEKYKKNVKLEEDELIKKLISYLKPSKEVKVVLDNEVMEKINHIDYTLVRHNGSNYDMPTKELVNSLITFYLHQMMEIFI